MKTLVLVAHKYLATRSIANQAIVESLNAIEGLEIRDLYQLYPDFKIDVANEQQALLEADLIIFQFPIHWYSVPGILKEWMDQVLLYGFAYGSTGNKLKDKRLLISTTLGGDIASYQVGGHNNFSLETLFTPLEQTAALCGMHWLSPMASGNMLYIPDVVNKKEEVAQRASAYGAKLKERIRSIKEAVKPISPLKCVVS